MPGIVPPMKVITVGPQQSRVAQACDRCRSKKIKCDGITPCCSQCASAEFECRTSDKLSRRAFPRGYTESLEERVRALEAELRELRGFMHKKEHIISVLTKTNPTSTLLLTHMGPPPLPMPSVEGSQSEREPESSQAAEIASDPERAPSPLESMKSAVWTTTRRESAGLASPRSSDPRAMTRKRLRSPETHELCTSIETRREEKISRLDLCSDMSKSSQSAQRASMRRARTSTTPYSHEGQRTLDTIPFDGPRRRRTTPYLSPVPSNTALLNLDHQSFFSSVTQKPGPSLESNHGSHGNNLDYFPFSSEISSFGHTDWTRMMGSTQTAHTSLVASASTSEAPMLTPTTTSSSANTIESFESSDVSQPAFYAETLDRPTSEAWAYSTDPAITPFDSSLQPDSRQQLPSGESSGARAPMSPNVSEDLEQAYNI